MKYAEEIMISNQCNQFFVHFYDDQHKQKHMEWFKTYFVSVEPVASAGDTDVNGSFFHVKFTGRNDHRLDLYSKTFEKSDGESLFPESYQMVEWDYRGWKENEDLQAISPVK